MTEDLISAFEMQEIKISNIEDVQTVLKEETGKSEDTGSDFLSKLGEYGAFVQALKRRDINACKSLALSLNKLEAAIVDAINEISVDEIGDILIEEGDDGYEILECYADMI